jgi:hypothetical protein
MSSDANPIQSSVTNLVQASQAPTAAKVQVSGGKSLPPGGLLASQAAQAVAQGNVTRADSGASAGAATSSASSNVKAAPKAHATAATPTNLPNAQVLVAQLNKHLNTTGRPDLYRVDPQSGSTIQEVNPANGQVIAQFAASEFPTLARSVGASGLLVDSLA